MNQLYDITIWDGSRLLLTADNIVASDTRDALVRGLLAIASRSRKRYDYADTIYQLKRHLDGQGPAPDGIRAFVAERPRGIQVV